MMKPRLLLLVSCAVAVSYGQSSGRVSFGDSDSQPRQSQDGPQFQQFQTQGPTGPPVFPQGRPNGTRQGKDLLDWIGLGAGPNVDPFLARTNTACLNGDLAECFKSRALNSLSEFFDQQEYNLNGNVRVVRMSRDVVREVSRQPYEFSSAPRSEESEWDQLVKFAARKAEKFVKTVAFEVEIPSEAVGENEVYAPRFLDEIADEIDTIENKKDTHFSRIRLKKLLIPMLIILKLFKLKLLLFLPLILGLASFKKFLGFIAIVIPGLIGFFKLCKPQVQNYHPPVYSQSGVGFPYYKENANNYNHNDYHENDYHGHQGGPPVSFGQDLAYQGYNGEYGK
ncbi:uncharacterized protein LOC124300678 [Neodiprion virginianus]|uniref:uncharacterized protein LOC124300678 n=1 Tax=Neodiprion virginianus TaxID=2961670 RepID=UPI001EE6DE28|nr:uncharacterized protein LOC124300678 [Neodiprion virginianus]XP_046610963.1 uncharacterized protein LOC124300678 [Neodiprion virginianus]